jgi:hypothetical protein
MAAGLLAACSSPAQDIAALTFPNGAASGVTLFMGGGAGWSFVPRTNLNVTSVGYLDLAATGGDANAVVTIWAGTNTAIGSYSGITDPFAQPGDVVSAAVAPLYLVAGQPYAITVHIAPLAGSTWYGALHDNSGQIQYDPFQLAPELTEYQAWQLKRDGTLARLYSDPAFNQQVLWLGPTFSFQTAPSRPRLTIAASTSNTVTLSWPTNEVGYVLQRSAVAGGAYLTLTNTPSVVGTNYSAAFPRTNAAAFFRLVK